MNTDIKHPLLWVDCNGDVTRLEFAQGEEKPEKFKRLNCPHTARPCSKDCACIALIDNGHETPGLVCLAFHNVVPLGVLDPNHLDLELVENMKAGSDLRAHLRATAKRGGAV